MTKLKAMTLLRQTFCLCIFFSSIANSVDCNFNQDTCGWTQAQDDDFDWIREKTSTSGSGPSHDHTLYTEDGYFMLIEAKDYGQDQKARIVSPVIDTASGRSKCFQFTYLMYGSEVGTLNVFLLANGVMSPPLWTRRGSQGLTWTFGVVTINSTGQVVLEGNGASSNYGDIAIDDIDVYDGACGSTEPSGTAFAMSCDFEVDMCGYENEKEDDLDWHLTVGDLSMTNNLTADHTTGELAGKCMTVSGNDQTQYFNARLLSSEIIDTGMYCITFFYRDTGTDVGSLSVLLLDIITGTDFVHWEDGGKVSGYEWNKAQFSLEITNVSKLVFDADLYGGVGDISIDDISVKNGTCQLPPNCDFDDGTLCSWRNDRIHDDYDWQVITDAKDIEFFGPLTDAQGLETGGFIQLDMARNPKRQESYIISDEMLLSGTHCFQFCYYSDTQGQESEKIPMTLTVYSSGGGSDFPGTPIWHLDITAGDPYFHDAKVPLKADVKLRLVIGGSVTQGQVLALDQFSFSTDACTYEPLDAEPASTTSTTSATTSSLQLSQRSVAAGPPSYWDCDFDEGTLCQWKVKASGDMTNRWELHEASPYVVGPRNDHTIILHISVPTTPNEAYVGEMQSKISVSEVVDGGYVIAYNSIGNLYCDMAFQPNTEYCMSFWLYMFSTANQDFFLQFQTPSSEKLLYKQGNVGYGWQQMEFTIPAQGSDYTLEFVSMQDTTGDNEIALDDIHVTQGQCKERAGPNCTFETGLCGWESSPDSDFDMALLPGDFSDGGSIPGDHTLETVYGHFLKASADNHTSGKMAKFQSASLTFDFPVCMKFYYFITIDCDSIISVNTQGSQDRHPIPLWDQQNVFQGSWQLGEVTIYNLQNTVVMFIVTIGQNHTGEIGIDDVTFDHGECPYKGETDFENGFDTFHNMYSNDFDWVIASPSDGKYYWLPTNDYSENSPEGHFAVATYDAGRSSGNIAELWSPLSPPSVSECTSFSLFVHGKDPGTLNVTLLNALETTRVVVWSLTPTPEMIDKKIIASFPHVFPSKFYVVFTAILGSDGGWAIDDIHSDVTNSLMCEVMPPQAAASTVAPPTMPPQPTTPEFFHLYTEECDFEFDFCNWFMDEHTDFNWTRTNNNLSHPFVPNEGRPGSRDAYFLTLPIHTSGESAVLRSPTFKNTEGNRGYTFRFWLNMNGPEVGQLAVLIYTDSTSSILYYHDTQTNGWERVELSVNREGSFNLTFDATRASEDQDAISIDDIEVEYVANMREDLDDDTVQRCHFESQDICGFVQDDTNDIEWDWQGGNDGVLLLDHTMMTPAGHALVIPLSEGSPGAVGRLTSDSIPAMSGCLTFWLLMPSDGAAVRVYLLSRQRKELLVQRQNNQGPAWVKTEVAASSNYPFKISLEAEILQQTRDYDLVLDDLALTGGACATLGACTFERDLCTWQNVVGGSAGDEFDWMRGSGATVDETGPPTDSTAGTIDGHYMYVEGGSPRHHKDRAWLESETFPRGTQCLHFHYHMQGASIGSLNVYTVPVGSNNLTWVWSLSGDQGSNWNSALVTVGTDLHNYQVRFEAVLGFSVSSDLAIDDILFMPDSCDTLPASAKISEIVQPTIPTQATSPQLTTLSVAGTCHFEDTELCNYQYDNTSDVGWKWSGSEKPYMGYVFNNSNGQFIYTVLGPSFPGDIGSRMISPLYESAKGTPQCLEFYYYMEGDDVGELNVYIVPYEELKNRDRKMMHWSQVFDGGPGWKRALVSLTHPARYYVVFESVRGNVDSYHGLDDVTIYNRECLSTDVCDFETDVCLWSNTGAEINTGLNWTRYQGMQMTVKMAPTVDHTAGTADGSYMMVESTLENKGKKAWLYSQVFPSTPQSPFCFSFWYYMYGNNVGKLRVYIRNSISSTSIYSDADLWELHGPIDYEWHLAWVNISSVYTQKPFMIILEAEVGDNAGGVFAVDDTEFQSADCSTEPSAAGVTADNLVSPDCNFNDESMCAWTSVGRKDFNDFTIAYTATGMTEEQSFRGDFLFADSELQSPIKIFGALSPLLPPTDGTSCFSFWYRMYKDVNSSLEIDMVSVGTSIPIWKAFPDNSDDWMPASVNIHSDWDYKLLIKARTGDIDIGSVMVDDVKLVHGPCPRSEVFDFENGLMGFTPSSDPDISWEVTPGHSSFVPADHTYQTSYGHVLQANLGTPNKLVIADMKTPLFPPTGGYECVEFWYMKNGTNSSWLSVLLTTNDPQNVQHDTEEQWTTTATTSHWGKVYVEIFNMDSYWIHFQAGTYGSSVDESAAIDDIRILPTNCPADADCDFEYDNCGYESSQDGSAKWESVKGLYGVTTMEMDHSTETIRGSYMEVIIPDNADRMYNVNLTSRHVTKMMYDGFCVSFWYYGLGDGVFQVSAKYGPQNVTTVFTKDIANDENVDRILREWKNLHVGLNKNQAYSPFQIVFTFSSQAAKASLALDDIVSYEMPCSDVIDRTEYQNNGEINPVLYLLAECDFEHMTLCTYENGNMSNANWTMFSIDTESESGTGIDYDHTKNNRYGHYIYLDTTGLPPNTTAQLISNPIPSDRVLYVCLDFSYIMNGKDVNRLNVYTVLGDTRRLYWTTSGDQGKDWHQKYVEIKGYTQDWQIMIEAVAGGGDLGDIGLDDVMILVGTCPGEASCTFEIDGFMCNMDQDNLDEADWDYWSGASGNNTDPQVDHTYHTDEGHYIRMHMNTTQIGDKASIFTKMYDDESAKCLEFWYHIKNPADNFHVLSTILRDERGVETTVGTYRGFFDEVWNQARYPITLSNLNKFQIGFQGQSGGPEGSIAIDDIMVSGDECDSFITCGFEASTIGPCGWEPVTNYSFPQWEVFPANHYMTVNFSDALQVTKLASESVYIGEFCLSMQYMIYGDNAGYLNISLEVEYPKYETKTIYSTYGSQDKDKWSNAFIYEQTIDFGEGTETVRFVITGTSTESFDRMKESVIKVTDIFFSTDYTACMEHKPDSLPPHYTCKNGGGTFPDSIVCNFIQNCKDGDDEENCGSCDFEEHSCNWIDKSNGPYVFEAMNTLPQQMDANDHAGKFMGVVDFFFDDREHDDREHTDFADFVLRQELGPSPSGCMMTFRYYMPVLDRADSGNIYVVLEENFEETELWHSAEPDTFAWQRAYVDIGGIHARFKLHIRASQLPFDNSMGIDDITFIGCSFPEPVSGPCPQDQFKCNNTEACIDNDKLCDFTDECGDGSDEDPVICAGYIMDNFEDSLGYWSEEIGNAITWRMHSGAWISTTSGPRRDHTLGTHFGHFIVMDPRGYAENTTAGLISPMFAPTQDDQCKIRFHYHMYGASDGLLTLFMKSNATGSTTVINEYRTTLNDSWLLSEQVLTSPDSPFQVLLKGRVVGYYTSEIGLDDISFTPACQLIGLTTSTLTMVTTSPTLSTKTPSTTTKNPQVTTTTSGTTTRSPQVTTKAPASVKTSQTPARSHSPTPEKHTSAQNKQSTSATSTAKVPVKKPDTGGGGSDSWKIAVGVVLGLVGLIAVIAGTLFYLKRRRGLEGFSFSLLKGSSGSEGGVSNPIFGRWRRRNSELASVDSAMGSSTFYELADK